MNLEQLKYESLQEIEFYTVLEKVASYSFCDLGREIVINLSPKNDTNLLRYEHQLINELFMFLSKGELVPFDGLSDTRTKFHKSLIPGSVFGSTDLLQVKDSIKACRLIKSTFRNQQEKFPQLAQLTQNVFENRILEKHIDEIIDDTGNVRDTASRELQRIRQELTEKSGRVRGRIERLLKKTIEEEISQENFFSIRDERYVIPIKSEYKKNFSGIIHGMSQTGSTVFIEPTEIIEMNNDISMLKNDEQRELYKILSQITSEIGENAHQFIESMDTVAHLDSIYARAKYAIEFSGIMPKIVDENFIELRKIYHPILIQKIGRKHVIPLSIEFSNEKLGHLISGPNAGGKTVALKSIGLSIAMALSGIFPIGECTTNYRNIFSSIGDHQSIENNLSTFSSQLSKLKDIIDNSDNDSLVLIDEICSGTDPQEGSALSCSILDYFIQSKLFFIVTTHQSSLKTYALTKTEIENASLEFDEEKLMPTYKFLSGIPGNSYAFNLAKSMGMSPKVLKNAESYLGDKQKELEESIKLLNQYRQEALKSRLEADRLKEESEKIKIKYDQKYEEIKIKRDEIVNQARFEAGEIVNNANKLIENTIRLVKEDKKATSEIKKEFESEKTKITKEIKDLGISKNDEGKIEVNDKSFVVGDRVVMRDANSEFNSIGEIKEIDSNFSNATVEFNGIKFKIKLNKLAKTKDKEKKIKSELVDYIKFTANTSIDVRGERAEQAIKLIDTAISDAILGNVAQLTVIHGKGTGALRKALQDFLKYQYQVKAFRNGTLAEGGEGVTVVDF